MRILITGGAGFIGSHVAERLLERGDYVRVVDDLSTGSLANIHHLNGNPRFHFLHGSVTDTELMSESLRSADVIYHLAAAVGVRLVLARPTQTIETNVDGTSTVLRLAAKDKKRVLITSTSEVYGKRNLVPFRETDDLVLGPSTRRRWSYACSKLIDEFMGVAYWAEKGVPTVIARMFNVVGQRQTGRYGMVVPTFIRQAVDGEDLTVYGDGAQTRCFLHVSDAVDALIKLAESDSSGEVYNIGATEEVSILHLAQAIQQMTNSRSRIIFVPYTKAFDEGFEDMKRRVPDISKIKQLIGFEPKASLHSILRELVECRKQAGVLARRNGDLKAMATTASGS